MPDYGDGLAQGADLVAAAENAVSQAMAPLGGRRPDLLAVFVYELLSRAALARGDEVVQV